jgi:hypothetical protein
MTDGPSTPRESRFPPDIGEDTAFASDWFRVERLGPSILRVARSSRPFVSAVDAVRRSLPVVQALDAIGRRGRSLLLDSRAAIGISDPVYESGYRGLRLRIAEGFDRAAVLVRTQAGQLHSRRLIENDGETSRWVVFGEEALALRYLRGKIPSLHPPDPGAGVKSVPEPRSSQVVR